IEEDKNFRALFGCSPQVVLRLWNILLENNVSPPNASIEKLLLVLMYCKTYPKWKTMRKLTNTDPKTLRKWIDLFAASICQIEGEVVSCLVSSIAAFDMTCLTLVIQIVWENRKKQDIRNDCLVSVDGVDFQIPYSGRQFKSHKFKFGSALRYEAAVCILTGELVWVNGPFEP
ncbi:MAG: hypothetical protein AAGM67_22230, partial [Bacteroidota bacterium]